MVRNFSANTGDRGSIPGLGRSPGEGNSNHFPLFSPGKSHGVTSLEGFSPWGHRRVGHDLATKQQQQLSFKP